MSKFEALPDELIALILGQLDPASLSRVKQWSKYFKSFVEAHGELLWRAVLESWAGVQAEEGLEHVWGEFIEGEAGAVENHGCTAAYLCYRFDRIFRAWGSTGYRMVRIFDRLFRYFYRNRWRVDSDGHPYTYEGSVIHYMLMPPREISEMQEMHRKREQPLELCALYSVCGGQAIPKWMVDRGLILPKEDTQDMFGFGMFGSSEVYSDEISLGLVPSRYQLDVARLHYGLNYNEKRFLVAMNFAGPRYKTLYVDDQHHLFFDPHHGMRDGVEAVYPGRRVRGPHSQHEITAIDPAFVHDPDIEANVAALGYRVHPVFPLVHWLECYVEQLESGNFKHQNIYCLDANNEVQKVDPHNSLQKLVNFPARPPRCVTAVSNGIEVSVAPALHTHCIRTHQADELIFAYEVKMRLLSLDEQEVWAGGKRQLSDRGGPLMKARLKGRYWKIVSPEESGGVQEVEGPGVIGMHPVLTAGGHPFSYCSYTSVDTNIYVNEEARLIGEQCFMEGHFVFDEVDAPTNRTVRAKVPRFHLEFPDVIL